MIKSAEKVLLLLFILLCGYSSMYANSYQDCTQGASDKADSHFQYPRLGIVLNPHRATASYTAASKKQENSKILAEEKEEGNVEFVFVSKFVETSHYFTFFYARAIRHASFNLKIYSRFSEYRSQYSSIRYLILRMIRI